MRLRSTREDSRPERRKPWNKEPETDGQVHHLTGVAAPLQIDNVDTDMIIPKQYLKTIKRTGLGAGLFAEMRYRDDGMREPRFRPQQAGLPQGEDHRRRRQFRLRLLARARALGAARFRHPLRDLDLDFADIFYNNCFKNGILPIKVSPEDLAKLYGRRRARRQRDAHHRSAGAGNPRPRRRRGEVRDRRASASSACSTASTTSASPWSRRRRSRRTRKKAAAAHPWR